MEEERRHRGLEVTGKSGKARVSLQSLESEGGERESPRGGGRLLKGEAEFSSRVDMEGMV